MSWRDGSCLQRWLLERAAPHMKSVPLLKPFADHNAHRGCLCQRERELPYGDPAGCKKLLPELCLIPDHV